MILLVEGRASTGPVAPRSRGPPRRVRTLQVRPKTKERFDDAVWDVGKNLVTALIIYIAVVTRGYLSFDVAVLVLVVMIAFERRNQ
jgi:hypothetical protein